LAAGGFQKASRSKVEGINKMLLLRGNVYMNLKLKSNLAALLLTLAFLLPVSGCGKSSSNVNNTTSQANDRSKASASNQPKASASFINKVWKVDKSNDVAPGHLYVFLSEGTLVITSPNSKPAFGSWKYTDGAFSITEEGLTYKVDIVKVSETEFHIRVNNPGQVTEIEFVAATE